MSGNLIFWYCIQDESIDIFDSGLRVWKVVPTSKFNIDFIRKEFEQIRKANYDEDEKNMPPSAGEVGWHACTFLKEGQYLIAKYDDYGENDGELVVDEYTQKMEDYLDHYSYYNEEGRGRPCRGYEMFYSFVVNWKGKIVYSSPISMDTVINYEEDEREDIEMPEIFEKFKCPKMYRLECCEGDSDMIVDTREDINFNTKEMLYGFNIFELLKIFKKHSTLWSHIPLDVIKIICNIIYKYDKKYLSSVNNIPYLKCLKLDLDYTNPSFDKEGITIKRNIFSKLPYNSEAVIKITHWLEEKIMTLTAINDVGETIELKSKKLYVDLHIFDKSGEIRMLQINEKEIINSKFNNFKVSYNVNNVNDDDFTLKIYYNV